MKQYLELLRNIRDNGDHKADAREGLPGTKSLFGPQIEFNLAEGFPMITTKKVSFHNIVVELLWFLRGNPNIRYLVENGVNIWNEDAYNYFQKLFPDSTATFAEFMERVIAGYTRNGTNYRYGDTGNQYPKTWRWFGGTATTAGIDQITRVIHNIKKNPNGRRHLVSSIDVANDQDLALYWCHALFQFNCRQVSHDIEDGYFLDCKLYQRSADSILGVPYNIASYALLMQIVAKLTGMIPGRFIHSFGDIHLYDNHQEAADLQLTRTPHKLPELYFSNEFETLITQYTIGDVWYTHELFNQLTPEMFRLIDYTHDAPIKATLNTGMKNGK
jgi:thymidylate synthase